MKVGIFYPQGNLEHLTMLTAFGAGLKKLGVDFEMIPVEQYKEVDVAVVFGIGKKNVPVSYARGAVIAQQKLRGKAVIVIEKGYVKRDKYYAVGFDSINGRADFVNHGMPDDRWKALGVPLVPWKEVDHRRDGMGVVLLCGQVPSDASVQNINIYDWCENMYHHIKGNTDRPVRFRPHPLSPKSNWPKIGDMNLSLGDLNDALKTAHAVVTFNSNIGVDAMINGIPAYAFDEGSMIHNICSNDITTINSPVLPNRKQWSFDLAYAQWNQEEIERGLPWLHLMKGMYEQG